MKQSNPSNKKDKNPNFEESQSRESFINQRNRTRFSHMGLKLDNYYA